jgi:putative ABC transport system ATP-binding protein
MTAPVTRPSPSPSSPLAGGRPDAGVGNDPPVVLELDMVTKTYPAEPPVEALRGVSFTVRRGELVGIVGPSGSGKTTLLHLIGTLDRPTSGTVRVTGFDISQLSDRELSALRAGRIGFVFQQFFLAEHQSVLDNVADGLLYAGASFTERRRAAADALARVGLSDKLAALPTKLSGGQRQRVAVARALVGRPALLLADEPTGNLDSSTGQSVLDLFAELNDEGATIIVITHDHGVAQRMGRVIELLDGLILADSGAPEDSRTASQSGDGRDVDDSYGSDGREVADSYGSDSDNDRKVPPWP